MQLDNAWRQVRLIGATDGVLLLLLAMGLVLARVPRALGSAPPIAGSVGVGDRAAGALPESRGGGALAPRARGAADPRVARLARRGALVDGICVGTDVGAGVARGNAGGGA